MRKPQPKGFDRMLQALGVQAEEVAATPTLIEVDKIAPDPKQPRKKIRPETIQELAASIRRQGLLHPIVVRPTGDGNYSIVAGQRRWEAFKLLGEARIPCFVRSLDDEKARAVSLVENLQREDLSPTERAQALKELKELGGLTWEQVGEIVGLSKRAVLFLVGLTDLDPTVRREVDKGTLSPRQARVLGELDSHQQREVAKAIKTHNLTGDQAAVLARELKKGRPIDEAVQKAKGEPRFTLLLRQAESFGRLVQSLQEKPPQPADELIETLRNLRRQIDALLKALRERG